MRWVSRSVPAPLLVIVTGVLVVAPGVRAGATTVTDLCGDANPCIISAVVPVADGSALDLSGRTLMVTDGGSLDVGTGAMSIVADEVIVEEGGELRANGLSSRGGQINVSADNMTIGGSISASGSDGGGISLVATGALLVSGSITANGMIASGFGGEIELSGGTITVAGNVASNGAADSIGGCVTVSAGGNVSLAGSIRVTGGDGGDLIVIAGGLQGGNLMLQPSTALIVDGLDRDGGSGGNIDLTARGDGQTTGHVTVEAGVQALSRGGPEGDGGCVTVVAAGEITTVAGSGGFDVSGGSPDGFAGEVSLTAQRNVLVENRLTAAGSGSEGIGGDLTIRAGLDLTLGRNARLSVAGADDGGRIDLTVETGELSVLSTSVNASGTLGGNGGEVRLRGLGPTADVIVAGSIFADGGSAFGTSPGRGGLVSITTGDSLTVRGPLTAEGGRIQTQGANGGGQGGSVMLTTTMGNLYVNGTVLAAGVGPSSVGGALTLASAGEVIVGGILDTTGNRQGGLIGIEASRVVELRGAVNASGLSSGNALGGNIEITADAEVVVTGSLNADGGTMPGATAGTVALRGCVVSVEVGASLTARGNEGHNLLVAKELISIAGSLLADTESGENELRFRDPVVPPVLFATATIVPPPNQVPDTTLLPCPECGDGRTDPPETCDDGNQDDGDGCSSVCQTEPPGLCDVNGDGEVDEVDIDDLVVELFDGDGDRAADVGGGTFAATSAADANEDGRVTVADVGRCVAVLLP